MFENFFLKNSKTRQSTENIAEKKESPEAILRHVNKVLRVGLLSALLLTSPAESKEVSADAKGNSTIESVTLLPVGDPELLAIAEKQRQWLENYILSPKYRERLAQEYMRYYYYIDGNSKSYQTFIERPEFVKTVMFGDEILITANLLTNELDTNQSVAANVDKASWQKTSQTVSVLTKSADIYKLLPKLDISWMQDKDWAIIDQTIQKRLNRIRSIKIVLKDNLIHNGQPALGVSYTNYDVTGGTVELDRTFAEAEQLPTTPVHEQGHGITAHNQDILLSTQYIMKALSSAEAGTFGADPTEGKVAIGAFRLLVDTENINDPNTEDFTIQALMRALANPAIKNNYDVQMLLKYYSYDDIVWMMNNN